MFCPECGKMIDDGLDFCPECGASTKEQAPAATANAPAANAAAAIAKKMPKMNKKLVAIIAAAVVVVVAIIIIIVAATGKGYEKVAKKYAEAELNGDVKTMLSLNLLDEEKFLEAMFESQEYYDDIGEMYAEMAEDEDVTSYDELIQAAAEEAEDEKEDEFKLINLEIKKSTELSESKLEKYTDAIEDELSEVDAEDLFDVKDIKKGYKVSVKYEYTYENDEGKEKTEKGDKEYIVVKYKGDWVVTNALSGFYF